MHTKAGSRALLLGLILIGIGCAGLVVYLIGTGTEKAPDLGGVKEAPGTGPRTAPEEPRSARADDGQGSGPPDPEPSRPEEVEKPEKVATPPGPAMETGTVLGRVVEGTGIGVEGAKVEIRTRQVLALGLVSLGPVKAGARTDRAGQYRLEGVPPGAHYCLTVTHERFAAGSLDRISVAAGGKVEVADVRLDAGAVVWGRVRSVEMGPLARVRVAVVDRVRPEALGGRKAATTRTEADGRFRLENLKPGKARLEAEAEGHAPGRLDVELESGRETGNLEVVLDRGLTLEGQVVDDQGQVLEGVKILAAGDQHVVETVSNGAGRFLVTGLRQGIYRVVGRKKGHGPGSRDRSQKDFPAGTRGIRLCLERRAALGGQVVEARSGEAVPAFTVAWGKAGEALHATRSFSEPRGRFLLEGLRPGPVVFEVRSPAHALYRSGEILLSHGDRLIQQRIELRSGGAVAGRVVCSKTNLAVAGARVLVTHPRNPTASVVIGGEAERAPTGLRSARTDEAGRFLLEHLTGTFTLKVRHPGLAPLEVVAVRFPEDGVLDLGDVVLGVGGTLRGFVAGADGKGDADAEVWIHAESGYNRRVAVDREGRFCLRFVPPGLYKVTLTRRGGKLAMEDILRMVSQGGRSVKVVEGEVVVLRF